MDLQLRLSSSIQ